MTYSNPLYETALHSLPLVHQGKVRDIFAVDNEHLLIVTTDRLSAFDVVFPTPVPEKGQLLTKISNFWFNKTAHLLANQLTNIKLEDVITDVKEREPLLGRSIIVKKLKALPIEAIVRGYLIGSGWKDYQHRQQICGIALPAGLKMAQQLPEPIFTPSSKAGLGEHDENISFADTEQRIGSELAKQIRDISVRIYTEAAEYARERGILIADTKFEFGIDGAGELHLIDEVLTPDSSRFWPVADYQIGTSPASFDKQYIRDYLETLEWNKQPPGPPIPANIIAKTTEKYRQVVGLLMN